MEIIVKGTGEKYLTPNQIILNFNFYVKGNTYEEVLEVGTNNVYSFINEFLAKENFTKEDLKTRSFLIKEETRYDEVTRKYLKDGFSFNQNATLKFDYDKDKLSRMMSSLSTLSMYPKCQINFGVKDEKTAKRSVIDIAYNDAKEQALAIASAAGLELGECVKVDFKPFTTEYVSYSNMDSEMMMRTAKMGVAPERVSTIFTPEDILISETLYTLWKTK